MKLIIDAYNCIHALSISSGQFVAALESYVGGVRDRSVSVVLVFDSGPFLYRSREKHRSLQLFFAGKGASADDYIVDEIALLSPGAACLVTADRELKERCRPIESLSPFELWDLIREVTSGERARDTQRAEVPLPFSSQRTKISRSGRPDSVVLYDESEQNKYGDGCDDAFEDSQVARALSYELEQLLLSDTQRVQSGEWRDRESECARRAAFAEKLSKKERKRAQLFEKLR